jgi:sigma-54 specific flagellar transcriptional regulator A
VRVIAATHRDLEAEIAAGRFREDLYYRLNVLPLNTPPLRERASDVPLLLNFFAKQHAAHGEKPITFAPDFAYALQAYPWPGNVRELSNLVDRFSTLYPAQVLHVQTVPSCMMPLGMAALQAEWLAQHGVAAASTFAPSLEDTVTVSQVVTPVPDDIVFGVSPGPEAGVSPFDREDDPMSHLLSSPAGSFSMPVKVFNPAPLSASNDEINEVEQAILLAQGIQTLPPEGMSLKQHLVEVERSLIEQALARTQGNVSQTAKLLQLQRTTLIEKINKYELRNMA